MVAKNMSFWRGLLLKSRWPGLKSDRTSTAFYFCQLLSTFTMSCSSFFGLCVVWQLRLAAGSGFIWSFGPPDREGLEIFELRLKRLAYCCFSRWLIVGRGSPTAALVS